MNGKAEVRLSELARADLVDILVRTRETFGAEAALRYQLLFATALRDMAVDPFRNGSVMRHELGTNVLTYHIRYSRERARHDGGIVRRPRHLLLYRVTRPDLVGIGRILHDVMEIKRHLPVDYGDA